MHVCCVSVHIKVYISFTCSLKNSNKKKSPKLTHHSKKKKKIHLLCFPKSILLFFFSEIDWSGHLSGAEQPVMKAKNGTWLCSNQEARCSVHCQVPPNCKGTTSPPHGSILENKRKSLFPQQASIRVISPNISVSYNFLHYLPPKKAKITVLLTTTGSCPKATHASTPLLRRTLWLCII